MKKLAFLAIAILMSISAQAQFKFGVRGGLNTMDINVNEISFKSQDLKNLGLSVQEAKYGLHFGVFTQFAMGKFLLQPEVLFNSNTVKYNLKDLSLSNTASIKTESYQYLDIPVLLGFKLANFRLMGGPVGHVFLNSKSDLFDIQGYDQMFEKMTYGWQAGIGVNFGKRLLLDVRYEGNFTKFGDHIVISGQNYNFDKSPSRLIASVGVAF